MREIEILVRHDSVDLEHFYAGPGLCAISELQESDLKNGDNFLVTAQDYITIEFDYPLDRSASFTFSQQGGFRALDFLRCVFKGYSQIYQEEHNAVGDMGPIPGMLNRAASDGPYGIWGHYMEDLWFEGATETAPGHFTLAIGS
jgi:hypothetical protein